ncbi:hypothetical protein [Azospirillum sp. sgz302134]
MKKIRFTSRISAEKSLKNMGFGCIGIRDIWSLPVQGGVLYAKVVEKNTDIEIVVGTLEELSWLENRMMLERFTDCDGGTFRCGALAKL